MMDIAALSETRFSKRHQLEEVGAGYNFFWSGRPRAERRDADVALAIRKDIVRRLSCLPRGTHDRFMSLRLPLRGDKFVAIWHSVQMVLPHTRALISEAQNGAFVQIEGQEPSAGPLVQPTKIFLEVGLMGSILDDFPDLYVVRKHGTITVQPIYAIIDEQEKERWSEHRALWDPTLYECAP
nr:unnamed protein product [Spirometra erinaceieuropaei]